MEERKVTVTAFVDANAKEQAEAIFAKIGLDPNTAINMFYKQVIAWNGLPFRPSMPVPPMPPHGAEVKGQAPFGKGAPNPGPFGQRPFGGLGEAFKKPEETTGYTEEPKRSFGNSGKTPEEEIRDQISQSVEQAKKFIDSTELGKIINDIKKDIGL